MKKFLVIGNPIEHSLSPEIHNYWFKKYRMFGSNYEKRKVTEKELKNVIEEIKNDNIDGINVTVPFKKSVIPFCDKLDFTAERIQSVNTIIKIRSGPWVGKIFGFTTDSQAFRDCIERLEYNSVFVLGSGGVTASILDALNQDERSLQVFLTNRTRKKAENLKKQFKGTSIKIEVIDWGTKPANKCDLVINTTSVGLKKEDKININFEEYKGKKMVFIDLIYNHKTHFLKDAEKRGNLIMNGQDMFLGQARYAFEKFTGVLPDIDEEVFKLVSYD